MKGEILITDSLFVSSEHEKVLMSKGFEIFRLNKVCADEAELIEAVRGKIGYILGGVERVSSRVIEAASELEVIAFTGSGYAEFIPAHAEATKRGIAITAARGGNAVSVSEFTLAAILSLVRSIPRLTAKGGTGFYVGHEFASITVGVIGLGEIGQKVAALCSKLGFTVLGCARGPSRSSPAWSSTSLDDLLSRSDVVTLHVDKAHGHHVLGARELDLLRSGSGLVNCAFPDAVEVNALFAQLRAGRIQAFFDAAPDVVPDNLPPGTFTASNAQTAFNTVEGNARVSDMVVASLLNVLAGREDPFVVNPDYRTHRTLDEHGG